MTMRKRLTLVFLAIGWSVASLLTAGPVNAGGLVDTSAARFEAAKLAGKFAGSQNITNPWWTLPAGRNFLYFAETEDECEWNLVQVLNDTTNDFEGIYAGTEARIVLDRGWVEEDCDYDDGDDLVQAFEDLVNGGGLEEEEATYDWYSQDTDLNIWYMGEDTYDGDDEGSFVAGCDGAEAGIVLLGNPSKGAFYRQEFYEDEAEDWGKVLNFKADDDLVCMKTKEYTPLDTGAVEHKFYCMDEDEFGLLTLIEELHGKTVFVELIDDDYSGDVPDPPAGPPHEFPDC